MDGFSVDRRHIYKVGSNLSLIKGRTIPPNLATFERGTPADVLKYLAGKFPDGLSEHGWFYMNSILLTPKDGTGTVFTPQDFAIELVFELVRREDFSSMPSRFQSYFAWQTKDEAINFASSVPGAKTYKIQSDESFLLDQAWLTLGSHNGAAWFNAHNYWDGNASAKPAWEILMGAPAQVLNEVVS